MMKMIHKEVLYLYDLAYLITENNPLRHSFEAIFCNFGIYVTIYNDNYLYFIKIRSNVFEFHNEELALTLSF